MNRFDRAPGRGPERSRVAILGIDMFRHKNRYQTDAMGRRGYRFDIFATQYNQVGPNALEGSSNTRLEQLEPGIPARIRQVQRYLQANHNEIHHAEIYVGGRFAFVYGILCRMYGIRTVVAERGDLQLWESGKLDAMTRASMWISYRLADMVWYRQPNLERRLAGLKVTRKRFLANAVPVSDSVPVTDASIDFVWANRFIPEYEPDRFARAIEPIAAQGGRIVMLGLIAKAGSDVLALQADVQSALAPYPSVQVLEYGDPFPWFARARYFVLSGPLVFGNFALLEAMSMGVVPIVSGSEGVDAIVEDGRNGIVLQRGPDALAAGIGRAAALNDATWRRMSQAARATIREKHNIDDWARDLERLYAEVAGDDSGLVVDAR